MPRRPIRIGHTGDGDNFVEACRDPGAGIPTLVASGHHDRNARVDHITDGLVQGSAGAWPVAANATQAEIDDVDRSTRSDYPVEPADDITESAAAVLVEHLNRPDASARRYADDALTV